MHVEAWDSAFVRARRADVHPILRDVAGYGRWWPGLQVRTAGVAHRVRHDPPGMVGAAHVVEVRVVKDRPDLGIDVALAGDFVGSAEWYYLDEVDGTVVHYVLRAETAERGWRRRLAAQRASVRAALDELKDRLEAGRIPGAEPDPQLLADQQAAIAEFTARVEAHRAAQAAAAERA
jgi:hypothetical protein